MPNSRGITYGPRSTGSTFDLSKDHVVFNGYETSSTGNSTHIHAGDITNQFNGVNFTATVEHTTMDLGNLMIAKEVMSCYPLFEGTGNVSMTFVGTNSPGEGIDFDNLNDVETKDFEFNIADEYKVDPCLLYTSPSPRDRQKSRMPSSA